jgi:hypothetical protein
MHAHVPGDWGSHRMVGGGKPCVTCGKPAWMVDCDGRPHHKVCFDGDAAYAAVAAPARTSGLAPERLEWLTSGVCCEGGMTKLSCQLCRSSRSYWDAP